MGREPTVVDNTARQTATQTLTKTVRNVLVPQLLRRSFQKARNFTASSHQNAGFNIWVF